MSEKSKNPLIYLAFANSQKDHLDGLTSERRAVYDAIRDASKNQSKHFDSDGDSEMDFAFLVDELQKEVSVEQLAIFHYGGHAGEGKLILESANGKEDPTEVETLAGLFGKFRNLQLIFLNGCSSETLVGALLDVGVPLVIASNRSIPDAQASRFSELFYREISQGANIKASFQTSKNIIEKEFNGEGKVSRSIERKKKKKVEEGFFWGIYQKEKTGGPILKWTRDENFDETQLEWNLDRVFDILNPDWEAGSSQTAAGTTIEKETIINKDGTKTERTIVTTKSKPLWEKMWEDKRVRIGVPSGVVLIAAVFLLMQFGFINDAPKFQSADNYNIYLKAMDGDVVDGTFAENLQIQLENSLRDFLAQEGSTGLIEILHLEDELPKTEEKKAELIVEVDVSDARSSKEYLPKYHLVKADIAKLNSFGPRKEDQRTPGGLGIASVLTLENDNKAFERNSELVRQLDEFILWSYGYNFFYKEDYDQAIKVWEQIDSAKTQPENYTPYYMAMAVSHLNKQQPDTAKALSYLDIFLEYDKTTGAYYSRGKIYYDQKKFDKALSDYNWILSPEDGQSPNLYDHQFKVSIEDKSKEIRMNRGNVNFNLRNFGPAIEDFTQFIKDDSSSYPVWVKRGYSYHMIDSFKRADDDFDYVLAQNPDNLEALFGKAKLYTDRYIYYKTTTMPSQIMNSGISQREKNRFNTALDLLKRGQDLDKTDPRFPLYLGNLYRTRPNDLAFAKKMLKEATVLNRTNNKVNPEELNYIWGMYHMSLPNASVDSMIKYFQKALDVDANHASALYEMGNIHFVYEKSRDVSKAIEYYQQCIKYDSTHAWAYLNMASLLKFRSAAKFANDRQGDREKAKWAYEVGHNLLYPHYSSIHYIEQLQLYAYFYKNLFRKECKNIQERGITNDDIGITQEELEAKGLWDCVKGG